MPRESSRKKRERERDIQTAKGAREVGWRRKDVKSNSGGSSSRQECACNGGPRDTHMHTHTHIDRLTQQGMQISVRGSGLHHRLTDCRSHERHTNCEGRAADAERPRERERERTGVMLPLLLLFSIKEELALSCPHPSSLLHQREIPLLIKVLAFLSAPSLITRRQQQPRH